MPSKTFDLDAVFKGFLDLTKHELRNAVLQNLSAEPSTPAAGQLFFDTDDAAIKVYTGSAWVILGTGFTQEQIEDLVGAMFSGNTETGISATYDDPGGKINLVLDVEYLQDTIGAMVSGGTETGISVTYDDANGRFDFVVTTLDALPAPVASLSLNSQKITNLANGTASTDAVNLGQVQALVNGLDWKANVRVVATANVNIANGLENGDAIDGVTLATGDRVLLTGQTTPAENGIYVVVAAGAASRATDADANAEVTSGLAVAATEGTTFGDTVWILTTNDPIVIGTTGLTFQQMPTPNAVIAGTGLSRSGQTLSIDTAVVVRKAGGTLTGGSNSEAKAHNLGNQWVNAFLINNASPFDRVEVYYECTDANTVTFFAAAGNNLPAGYRWVAQG